MKARWKDLQTCFRYFIVLKPRLKICTHQKLFFLFTASLKLVPTTKWLNRLTSRISRSSIRSSSINQSLSFFIQQRVLSPSLRLPPRKFPLLLLHSLTIECFVCGYKFLSALQINLQYIANQRSMKYRFWFILWLMAILCIRLGTIIQRWCL